MFILVISSSGYHEVMESGFIPRVGDKVDLFYYPYPVVNSVLLWPKNSTISGVVDIKGQIDAVVTVE